MLLHIVEQIAEGMEYLIPGFAWNIYRGLAKRNCLITTAGLEIKIADFGLSCIPVGLTKT